MRYLLVPAALVLVVLVAVHPALSSLDSAVIGDGGDNYQFLGFQFLAHRLFERGNFPFGWTDFWRYPFGVEFQNIYDSTFLIVLGLFLYSILDDPIRVYNVSVLLLVLANVSLTYVAFRTWFRPAVAFTGAIIFGLSFYSLAKVGGHVNLLTTAGFPLFFSAVYRVYRDRGSVRSFAWLVVSSLVLAFSSLQYPLVLLGSLPFLIPLAAVFFPKEARAFLNLLWQRKLVVLLSGIALVSVFSLFHGKKLRDVTRGEVMLPADLIVSVPAVNFFVPNAYIPTVVASFANGTRSWIEYGVFLGYVEMVFLVVAATTLARSRVKWFLLLSAAVFFVLSLGRPESFPGVWPYPYLFARLPYRAIIEPGRFSTMILLPMTALILLFLAQPKQTRWLVVAACCLMVERLPLNFYLSPTRRDPDLVRAVRARPTKAVLDLPAYAAWWNGQIYDLYSVYYDLPIVTGYLQWSGDTPDSRTLIRELRELACFFNPEEAVRDYDEDRATRNRERVLSRLRQHGIRTIVLHKDLFGTEEQCGAAPRYIDALFAQPAEWEVLLETDLKRVLWWRP